MPKYFKAKCPNCGSQRIVGWYDEQGLKYHVEAFPEWFEIIEEAE